MVNFDAVENKFLSITLNVTGIPQVMYPDIGDDMSNCAVITEYNKKEYTTPFMRVQGECSLLDFKAEIMELYSFNNIASLTFIKEFIGSKNVEIEGFVNTLSNLIIEDELTGEYYNAQVIGIDGYDIQEF